MCDLQVKHRKALVVPKLFQRNTVQVHGNQLLFRVGPTVNVIDLRACFDIEDINSFAGFRVDVVVSNFNDLHVGDLAFLSMTIGANNSSGAHSIHCLGKRIQLSGCSSK